MLRWRLHNEALAKFGLDLGNSSFRQLQLEGALEVRLSSEGYDAQLAERYGINRALPASTLEGFVRSLAHRIAGFQTRDGEMALG